MKKFLLAFAVASCVAAFSPSVHAQGAGGFAINAIVVNTPKTPEPTTQAQEQKRSTLGTWVEVEVDFAAAVATPELTFKYYILIAGQMLTGEVTHVNILPGRNLFSVMYVAPRTVLALTKGQPITAQTVQNVAVQILRPGVNTPLAEKALKPGFAFGSMKQVTGFVFNKAETPFANLWWDRYEAIKPNKQ